MNFLTQFASQPSLVAPEQSGAFHAYVAEASALMTKLEDRGLSAASEDFWFPSDDWRSSYRPYDVRDGLLTIPVQGVLLNGFPWQLGDYATGYEYIWRAFERGMADPDVTGIALNIDSPGGAVAGNFDMVDKMFALRGTKPVRAYANESAYSAAYSIASVADNITVSRTGGVGSIGVVTSHVDYSEAMSNEGVKITFIYAGDHKVDGNPYQPLPDAVKERIQSRIDGIYDIFVASVARNRGIDEKAVRTTEAATFTATEAVQIGLADAVGSYEDSVAAFSSELKQNGVTAMPQTNTEDLTAAVEAARQEGMKAGATAERARIKAIMESAEAADRRDAAFNIALNSDMNADSASSLLAVLPKNDAAAAAPANAQAFEKAMSNNNPEVGAVEESASAASPLDQILADARAAGVIARKA